MKLRSLLLALLLMGVALLAASCGGGEAQAPPATPISISLSPTSVTLMPDGTPSAPVNVTVTRPSGDTNPVTLRVQNLPNGVTTVFQDPGTGSTGSVTFSVSGTPPTPAGSFAITVGASDGITTADAPLTLVVILTAKVSATVNTSVGENGTLNAFMTTSFQPSQWDDQFFINNPGATTTLNNLGSQHIRLQLLGDATPQQGNQGQTWDFTVLNAILDPVISVTDHSPEMQLAVAPSFMDDSNGHIEPAYFQDFANYAADMVEYYNTATGFTDSQGNQHVNSTTNVTPITWWGIFNEPNINGLTAAQYTQLYNAVVPTMQAATSNVQIKFVAVELADFGQEPENYMPTFVSGVTAPVDVVATHFYSSCNQSDSDQQLMSTVPGFASDVKYIYSQLKTNPALANKPIWVTENNVNADYSDANGNSVCNPGHKFVTDQRGTSAFFAAWRPYVFSQLAQAGAQALYQWVFPADAQYGEVDYSTGNTFLSYWVDYYLGRYFLPTVATPPVAGQGPVPPSILTVTASDTSTVEILATENQYGNVVVMLANHGVNSSGDNNGPGTPCTVILDLSALGTFSSGTQMTIDATTNATTGPTATAITPATQLTLTLNGYGVTFLSLSYAKAVPAAVPRGGVGPAFAP